MWRLFDSFIGRPAAGLLSSLQLLWEDVPVVIKMDAMIGRVIHTVGRPITGQYQSAEPTSHEESAAEGEKERGV
jgi:nitric oxide synthase oxygenase domain/subunit